MHNFLTWFTGVGTSILLIGVVGLWNIGVKNHDAWIRIETLPERVKAIERIPYINTQLNKQQQTP